MQLPVVYFGFAAPAPIPKSSMTRIVRIATAVAVLIAGTCDGAQAATACTAPTPPSQTLVRPETPKRPICGELCSNDEIRAFNAKIKAFNEEAERYKIALGAYAAQLNEYVAAAGVYAKCALAEVQGGGGVASDASARR